jgi:hypothetical protein
MRRFHILAFMLFAMLWQSVAMARIGSTVNAMVDPAHAAMHWHEEAHHHNGDGSYHLDDSNESAQHVVIDHTNSSVALEDFSSPHFPPPERTMPKDRPLAPTPDPDPDGLLRPPRHHS